MKYALIFAVLLLSITSCSDQEQTEPATYQLRSLSVEGSALDPIPDGIQLGVYFESEGEDLSYELTINGDEDSFSTVGSYVLATEYLSMPMAPLERISYEPSLSGSVSKQGETYVFDDPIFSLDFGTTDLNEITEGKPMLNIDSTGVLTQIQVFVVEFSDDGIIDYVIKSTWIEK